MYTHNHTHMYNHKHTLAHQRTPPHTKTGQHTRLRTPQAGIDPEHPTALSAVAVSAGPGLAPCLAVGVRAASEFASAHALTYLPVNHLEAHALVTRLPPQHSAAHAPSSDAVRANQTLSTHAAVSPAFPFLLLLLSGGHCQLLLCEEVGRYTLLGGTLDDSIGEAYDKVARVLGLQDQAYARSLHPGALLEEVARSGDPTAFRFTAPLSKPTHRHSCDFSFAGLKSAVQR
jgi:tRNA A37 threonylcarbamoyltransferase TsaD